KRGLGGGVVVCVVRGRHAVPQYRAIMAKKQITKVTTKVVKNARRGKARPPQARAKADQKAQHGATKPWSKAEVEEAFRRFQAAMPEPKGELQHINPFTLLV